MNSTTISRSAEREAKGRRRRYRAAQTIDTQRLVLRLAAALAQAATLLITAPLWLAREYRPDDPSPVPPLLPAQHLPQFDVLPWVLLSVVAIAVSAVWPFLIIGEAIQRNQPRIDRLAKWSVGAHCCLLVLAMLMDQWRIQPQIVSLAVLMIASLPGRGPLVIGRAHLVAMWFYAGLHKLVSPGFYAESMPFLLSPVTESWSDSAVSLASSIGGVIAAGGEMLLGPLALWARTRKLAAVAACIMHVLLLFWLSTVVRWKGAGWNSSIWPWNAALAVAAMTLIWPWRGTAWEVSQGAGRWAKLAALVIVLSPIGYSLGVLDAFLAHCLYDSNVPKAHLRLPDGAVMSLTFDSDLNASLPPAHRLFEAYFQQVGQTGETLVIDDPRWCARWFGYSHREIKKPNTAKN